MPTVENLVSEGPIGLIIKTDTETKCSWLQNYVFAKFALDFWEVTDFLLQLQGMKYPLNSMCSMLGNRKL